MGVGRQTFLALGAVLDPRWAPDHPKTSPRRLLGSIFKDLKNQVGRFLVPNLWLVGPNLVDVGTNLYIYIII